MDSGAPTAERGRGSEGDWEEELPSAGAGVEGEEVVGGEKYFVVMEGGEVVPPLDPVKLGRQKLMAVVVAVAAHVVLLALFGAVMLTMPQPKAPDIVASVQAPLDQDSQFQQEMIEKVVRREPVQSAQNLVEVVTVQGASAVSMPDITSDLSNFDPVGMGDDFGSSMTFDAGADGGMVSFFGSKSVSKKLVFAVDYSASMAGPRDKLMRVELAKSINALPGGIQYQMIFFHGPAWVAGEEVFTKGKELDEKDSFIHYLVKGGKGGRDVHKWYSGYDEKQRVKKGSKLSYVFHPATGSEYPEKLPKAEYLASTRSNVRNSLKIIEETPLGGGTDWRWPLYMAMNMEPDTIFFMTDGAFSARKGLLEDLVSYNNKKGRAKINTICMMVPNALDHLAYLADKTRGELSLVLEDQTVLRGKELEEHLKKRKT